MVNKTGILVLAAGSSKRMGTAKQLLKYKKGVMLTHILEQALSVLPKDVYVVLGANNLQIQKHIDKVSVHTIINKNYETGIGSSIAAGVSYLNNLSKKYQQVLILLGDQPTVNSDFIEQIIAYHSKHQKTITVTQTNLYTGVPVVFDRLHFLELEQVSGDNGAKQIIKEKKPNVATFKVDAEIPDIDTREDYNKIIKSL